MVCEDQRSRPSRGFLIPRRGDNGAFWGPGRIQLAPMVQGVQDLESPGRQGVLVGRPLPPHPCTHSMSLTVLVL
jgi:hypothetical protein